MNPNQPYYQQPTWVQGANQPLPPPPPPSTSAPYGAIPYPPTPPTPPYPGAAPPTYPPTTYPPPTYPPPTYPPTSYPPTSYPPTVVDSVAQSAMRMYGERILHNSSTLLQRQMGLFSSDLYYHLFHVNTRYVLSKLLLLLAPMLYRGRHARQQEQIAGSFRYKPPRHDVQSPDLYLPSMSLFTWVLLCCVKSVAVGTFSTDLMYAKLWRGMVVWSFESILFRFVVSISTPQGAASGAGGGGVPFLELVALGGYVFFYACLELMGSILGGRSGMWVSFGYAWLCMAIFLRNVMKEIFVNELRLGHTESRQTYLIFAFMLSQGFWLQVLST